MKNVKNVVKGLLVGMVVVIGCLVNCNVAKADVNDPNVINHYTDNKGNVVTQYKDGSYCVNSDVEIQSISYIDNTITINKDGELFSFYDDNVRSYYLGEQINITMNDKDEVIDCVIDTQPVVYNDVSIIYADNDVCCIRIGQDVYSFDNEDSSYKVNDKINVVMQNDNILQVIPCIS